MILKLSLDLPEDGSYVRITRLIGRTLLEHLHVVDADITDLEILVGELCSNVIRHAQSSQGRFRVVQEYHADRVDLTVEDQGPGFLFKEVLPAGTERPDSLTGGERIGGFGMGLVQALADRLEFQRTDPQGTTVQASVELHYETPTDAQKAADMDTTQAGEITMTAQ